jgi:hydroxymethylglutaryl-CoA reductase
LIGALELPLSLGTVGGPSRVHDGAMMGLRIVGVTSATELAMVAASVGMASNLAALRALATEGIQRGHMALHARSVAIAAGATGPEVERVAARIHANNEISLDAAKRVLHEIRTTGRSTSTLPAVSPAE